MSQRQGDDGGPPAGLGWGCLAIAILAAGAAILLAVIFVWDVNARH